MTFVIIKSMNYSRIICFSILIGLMFPLFHSHSCLDADHDPHCSSCYIQSAIGNDNIFEKTIPNYWPLLNALNTKNKFGVEIVLLQHQLTRAPPKVIS